MAANPPLMDVFWVVFSACLVFLMQPGFMCLESGLTRSKNSINVAVKNLADFCLSAIGFWMAGFAFMFGASKMGIIGTTGFFFSFNQEPFPMAFFLFQIMFCGTATTIFSGAVAERMRFDSYLIVAGLLSLFVYPVFGHWAWNGLDMGSQTGWLGRQGFVDFAGSTVVHSVGGWIALASLLVIGPRNGRFPKNGPPRDITGSNLPLAILGVMLLWIGWFGFNGGSTLALNNSVPRIIVNTALAAASGAILGLGCEWFRTGLPKVTALMNGALGGLVAITASCHCIGPSKAIVIGAVAGVVSVACEQLLLKYKIDDAVGAVPVHLGCGIWGTLGVAFFGDPRVLGTGLSLWNQFLVQLEGIVAAFVIAFIIPYFLIKRLDRHWPLRVNKEEEKNGLNISEHGATTELHDLFESMDQQAATGDLSIRVPVEPFTEVGQIATRYNQVMEALENTSSKVEAIFRSATDAIVTFATDSYRIMQVNPSASLMFGFDGQATMIGRPVFDLFDMEESGGREGLVQKLLSHKLVEVDAIRQPGKNFPVEGSVTLAGKANDTFYVGTFRDISARRAAEEELQQQQAFFQELFESSPLGILMTDTQGRIMDANQGFTSLFGYTLDDLRDKNNLSLLMPEGFSDEINAHFRVAISGKSVTHEAVLKNKDGRLINVSLVVYPIRVKEVIRGVYCIYGDITERKEFETQLSHQAFHDALTGLPNRVLFFEQLTTAIRRQARNKNYRFSAMMLDMDRFKAINDTLGHQIGDEFLIKVGDRIGFCIRGADTVARLGGDEFGIILEDIKHPKEVLLVAKRIMEELKKPMFIKGNEIHSSASLGIVLQSGNYMDAEAVMRDADIAMYRAKEVGKARFRVFNSRMHTRVLRESELERELHLAIQNNELTVYYQPIVAVKGCEIKGFEALVRWQNPRRGMTFPDEFIPVAEETGQIIEIGRFVLKSACRQMAEWRKLGPKYHNLTVSVNVSGKQFRSPGLIQVVQEALAESGLPPEYLKLELTESTLMKDVRSSIKTMENLKEMGVHLVIDDFGTGYSSLSYVQRFPIDELKIDRSFISGEGDRTENSKIVQTIVALAKNIGVEVVAEGIEEESQLEMLKMAECTSAQGFMFSKPMDAVEIGKLLKEN